MGEAVVDVLAAAVAELATHGIPNPRLDAEVLLASVLQTDRAGLYTHLRTPILHRQRDAFQQLIHRRAWHEPLQYLTGVQEFWSLAFKVDRRVLIPRPETECVVEVALELLAQRVPGKKEKPLRLLDIGTGSGCLAIALAKELLHARVWATDISNDALALAADNARCHGVGERITFLPGDLLAPVTGTLQGFDLIVTNPPYIAHSDLTALQPEVQNWEPHIALDGGSDGLSYYRRLLCEGAAYLRPGGWVVMEVGQGQSPQVLSLIQDQHDLCAGCCVPDYAGCERVVFASRVKLKKSDARTGAVSVIGGRKGYG